MKKITLISSMVLCILISAVIFQPSTMAQSTSERDKVLQILDQSSTNQPDAVDPQKDYVPKKTKERKQKVVAEKDGTKLEFGSLKENIVYNDFLFPVYNVKYNGEKGYLLFSYARDKNIKTTWNLLPSFFMFRTEKAVANVENLLFGNDPVERQKFIEKIIQNCIRTLKQVTSQPKSSSQ